MNGYDLSRKWFDFVESTEDKVTGNHFALFMWVCELCNRLNWKPRFTLPTDRAMEMTHIKHKTTYYNCLKDLARWDFIEIVEKSKNLHTGTIVKLKKVTVLKNSTLNGSVDGRQMDATVPIDKPLKTTKPNKPLKTKGGIKDKIIFPFDSKEFLSAWNDWKEYKKKEHRFNFKSEISENAALNDLKKISDDNEQRAIELINQAIAKGWKGIFLGNINGHQTGKRPKNPHDFRQEDMDYSRGYDD